MRTNLATLIAPVFLGLLCAAAPARAADTYEMHDLGTLTNGGGLPEIVAGHYIAPVYAPDLPPGMMPPERYVIVSAGVDRIATLGTLGGERTVVYAANASGALAGSSDVPPIITPDYAAFPGHAFEALPGGPLIDLGTFTQDPTLGSTAFGISADGRVVGRAAVDLVVTEEGVAAPQHAFLHDGQGLVDLGTFTTDNRLSSTAYAVNAAGQVVGSAARDLVYTDEGVWTPQHAFLWQGGVMQDLGALTTDARLSSVAYGINEAGQIAGTSATGIATGDGWEMLVQHAFFADGSGSLLDLGTLGGTVSFGFAIDDLGRIVGRSTLAAASGLPWDEEQHAFVWSQGEMIDLGVLAAGRPCAAYAIDPDGRIYGLASDADWNLHLVVWERADDGPGSGSHSGLGDGSNPGHGAGRSHSPNQGTGNPHQR